MKKLLFPVLATIVAVLIIVFIFIIGKRKEEAKRQDVLSDVPVNVYKVQKQELSNLISMVGVINPDKEVEIISEAQGVVKAVHFKVGNQVEKGAVMFEIDDLVCKSDMARAEINYFKAKRDFERNKTLYEQNSISAAQLDLSRLDMQSAENDMTRSQKALDDTKVKATISGTINAKRVSEGSYVQPGASLASIVDISTLGVTVNVSEKDAFMLHPGDSVEITTDVYPGKTFYGHVNYVVSKAADDHTFPVDINLPNSSVNPLKGGMFARVNFTSVSSRNTLVIPREAISGSVRDAMVFVVSGDIATLRSVTIGRESGQFLEILNGLQEGELVVTSGQNNLSDNTKVVVVK